MSWFDFFKRTVEPATPHAAARPAAAPLVPRESTPAPRPQVTSFDLRIECALQPTASGLRLDAESPTVHSVKLDSVSPRVLSFPITRQPIKTIGFTFAPPSPQPPAPSPQSPVASPRPPLTPHPSPLTPPRATRIKPPSDIIKLEDRLFYVLQPPLESWMASQSLELPFHPFPYQFEGIAFLYPRYAAVLADEMGLGKTMQAITAIRLLLRASEVKSVLLICPKPLVTNWQREFQQWAPEIPLTVIEGDQPRRHWQWRLAAAPLKIANYELLLRDKEVVGDGAAHFDLVVLDEAQRIKNRSNTTAQVVRSISRNRGWALTGTPVENSADDLVGIFEFLSPGYLNSNMKPSHLGRLASEYVLRRTKEKVLTELPPKLVRNAEIDLTPEQRETYRLAEEQGVLRLTEMGQEATIQHVFELVLRLKQICNFDPATGESAKLERLLVDLDEVAASGKKAIVFSQWVSTIRTLAERLARYRPLEFHGQTPSHKRDDVLSEFKHDRRRPVLLISYGAGSVGLNLQFSEYVFLFDRWWNPAIEDQAINRAHRIGCAGPVTVTRFVSAGTIEQRIDQILEEKRELFDTIFSDTAPRRQAGLTQDEIFGLFQLKGPAGPIRVAA
jgi:SNF2 family DNA or RNA helicase